MTAADLIARISERREALIKEHGYHRRDIGHIYDADILKWQAQLGALLRAKRSQR